MTTEKQNKETPRQRNAFLDYFALQGERSLVKLGQKLGKKGIQISGTSLAKWSSKFNWQERVRRMDDEAQKKAEELAIQEATIRKSQILETVKNTMIKYNQNLLDGDYMPTASDFKKMWEIMRAELGLKLELPNEDNQSYLHLHENEKVKQIIKKAEDELYCVIQEDIEKKDQPPART